MLSIFLTLFVVHSYFKHHPNLIANKWSIRWQLLLHIISHHCFFSSSLSSESNSHYFFSIHLFFFPITFSHLFAHSLSLSCRQNVTVFDIACIYICILHRNKMRWWILCVLQGKKTENENFRSKLCSKYILSTFHVLCTRMKNIYHTIAYTYIYSNENIKYYSLLLYFDHIYNLWNNK